MNTQKNDMRVMIMGLFAIMLLAFSLQWLQPPLNAQAGGGSVVGVNTRFGSFSNQNFGPAFVAGTNLGYSNGIITLTNGQTVVHYTNSGAEVAIDAGRGLGLHVLASSTNWGNTNTLTFSFDVSVFGSTNKTSALAGANTNFMTDGPYGNYTGCGTNTSGSGGSAFLNITVVVPGSNTVSFFTNIAFNTLDNARWIRLTQVSCTGQSTVGANIGLTTVSNIVWSKFP